VHIQQQSFSRHHRILLYFFLCIICSPLSEVHFSLAVAHIYNSSEKDDETVDPIVEKKKALAHYHKARDVSVFSSSCGCLFNLLFG
jgi:hypothetical protein